MTTSIYLYLCLMGLLESIIGKKTGDTRVIPVTLKITVITALFLLVSNLTTNYINLIFNQNELIDLSRSLLAKDLRDIQNFATNQHEIFKFNNDLKASYNAIETKAVREFENKKSILIGFDKKGKISIHASAMDRKKEFSDKKTLDVINQNFSQKIQQGFLYFEYNNSEYFGIYKYNDKWDMYLLRGEEVNQFLKRSNQIFREISVIIVFLSVIFTIVGVFFIRYILRYIPIITRSIMLMVNSQKLEIIDLKKAPNDEITYMGMAFNSLSSTIDNLVNIFRKFVNHDVAEKAYAEGEIRLEGTQRDLTILFSDIKRFTFITETLGADIIKLLNMHYERAIREIDKEQGVIGSIIGDALLAVFGVLENSHDNKSYQAVRTAFSLQEVAESLRIQMDKKKEEIVRSKRKMTAEESRVYEAVLLEIGVGIDGGNVFYGNIGSSIRMTNTVIGDNVNSSSRLEGLTRIYKVPVIVSEYVKDDIEKHVMDHGIEFVFLDLVQVKGKTEGKKVYWPVRKNLIDRSMEDSIGFFERGLDLYMNGKWSTAYTNFQKCKMPLAEVFLERTSSKKAPSNWDGIWKMTTK